MDGLDQAIGRAEQFDRDQAAQAEQFAQEVSPDQPKNSVAENPEAGADMAESLLKVGEGICRAFVDKRLMVDDDEIAACRAGVGPVLGKYGLVAGDGKLPYGEEIGAGLYLGGLWMRFRRALSALREQDEAEKKAKEQANGDQRKHKSEEPARAVSGEDGLWEIANTDTAGGNPFIGGEGGSVGYEQGSSSPQV